MQGEGIEPSSVQGPEHRLSSLYGDAGCCLLITLYQATLRLVTREGFEPSVPNLTPPCEVIRTLAAFLVKFRPDFTAGPAYQCFA